MRFVQRSLMGLFLLAVTLGLLALAGGSIRTAIKARMAEKPPARPARERVFTVNLLTVRSVTAYPKIETFGEIRSRRTLDLRAPVAGTVIELSKNFVKGGRVSKGELLVRLDPANAQSALDVAQTDITQAKAELSESKAAILLAGDELSAARAQGKLRKAALARQQNLAARGVGTTAAVEVAALAEAASKQAILAKRQALALARARVARAKTALSRQELRLNDARRKLSKTQIYAGFDGVLSNVDLVKGGLVGMNEKLARLIDPNALEVAFRVSNTQFSRLAAAKSGVIGGKVLVRLEAGDGGANVSGLIERVSAEVGLGQTGRQMFARLPKGAGKTLRPGDFVGVTVDEPPIKDVAILPAAAVDPAGNVLVLGAGDRLQSLAVTVLRKQGDRVIVSTPALLGREVVKARTPQLGVGIRVKPLRHDGAENSAKASRLIALSPARRQKLVAFVSASKALPKDARARFLAWLKQDKVPAAMVARIESRMGG